MTDGADPLSELRAAWERAKSIPGVMVPASLAWAILRAIGEVEENGPRVFVTGRVESTIVVPEQEPGLVISVNGKRYIREDEVQRALRSAGAAAPILGRAEPAPTVTGRVSFEIERIVPAADLDAIRGRRHHLLCGHLAEMMHLLAGSLEEPKIGSHDYRIRISVEPE